MHENDDNLCQDLYDLLQKDFLDNCKHNYEHGFSGGYDYFCSINGSVMIYFPNYKRSHQS